MKDGQSKDPRRPWKPSLTRSVIAGLWHLINTNGAADILRYNLGPAARASRGVDRKAHTDLKRAALWIENRFDWEEEFKPGLRRRIGKIAPRKTATHEKAQAAGQKTQRFEVGDGRKPVEERRP